MQLQHCSAAAPGGKLPRLTAVYDYEVAKPHPHNNDTVALNISISGRELYCTTAVAYTT